MEETNEKNSLIKSTINKTYSDEDYAINFMIIPSLERMALMEIVIALWREVDRRAFRRWRRTMEFLDRDCFDDTVSELKEKIYHLDLPKSFETKILKLVNPVGEHIWEWRKECYYKDYDINSIQSIDVLQWTYRGTIDRSKTMGKQITLRRTIHKLYAKACNYCIEHQIETLWHKLLNYEREMYSKKVIEDGYDSCLEIYWTCIIRNDHFRLSCLLKSLGDSNIPSDGSIHEIMMWLSISIGNISAVNYFWYQLSEEERTKNLKQWVTFAVRSTLETKLSLVKQFTEIVCFLLSHLEYNDQKDILQAHGKTFLEVLVTHWPWQDFLIPIMSMMWEFLDINTYVYLISVMVKCIHGEYKKEVRIVEESHLNQLWKSTPKSVKKEFFQCVASNVHHVSDIFRGKKFGTSWIFLAEFLFGRDVEPDTLRDCQFIYKSLSRRNTEYHALKF